MVLILDGQHAWLYSCVFPSIVTDLKMDYPSVVIWEMAIPRGGGVLPYKRLIGMCRWMGSHFHNWSDYNGVAFLIDLLEWGRKFSDFWGK